MLFFSHLQSARNRCSQECISKYISDTTVTQISAGHTRQCIYRYGSGEKEGIGGKGDRFQSERTDG